ncbi:hypothetical protein fHeYen902_105c [Yersinia phage fHe-Yen9-02]|nr:hypothetical protein fHeYen902_105c [Yersinia phage fHe-Yen9-02]
MLKSSFRVVADLFGADGSCVTHVVRTDIKAYREVEKEIARIRTNPPKEYERFLKVSPRFEVGFSL